MSHRETHRVRTTQHDRIDPEAASRVMTREWRSATPRRAAPDDDRTARAMTTGRDAHPDASEPGESPARVHARLARHAVMPGALALACSAHDAAPGAYCYSGARGVCGDRLDRRPRQTIDATA